MSFQIIYRPAAQRDLRKLAKKDKPLGKRILDAIDTLAPNPYASPAGQLTGFPHLWRVRVGDYRVCFVIDADAKAIFVARIHHRRDAYKSLDDILAVSDVEHRDALLRLIRRPERPQPVKPPDPNPN